MVAKKYNFDLYIMLGFQHCLITNILLPFRQSDLHVKHLIKMYKFIPSFPCAIILACLAVAHRTEISDGVLNSCLCHCKAGELPFLKIADYFTSVLTTSGLQVSSSCS